VVSITPRPPLPPGKEPPVPTVQEAGWAPEPVWTQRLEEKGTELNSDFPKLTMSKTVIFQELRKACCSKYPSCKKNVSAAIMSTDG
jgi:hypothetical protein